MNFPGNPGHGSRFIENTAVAKLVSVCVCLCECVVVCMWVGVHVHAQMHLVISAFLYLPAQVHDNSPVLQGSSESKVCRVVHRYFVLNCCRHCSVYV